MPSYEVSGPIDLEVTVGVGFVEVVAADRTDAVVEVVPSRPGRSGDESLARESTVSFDNGRVRVTVPRRLSLFSKGDSVDVRGEVPTGSRVTIETAYGSVRSRGVLGDARIVAKYGGVTADTIADLVLDVPYGSTDIAEVTGRLDVTAGHGVVRVAEVRGEARLRASHGAVELGTTVGEVHVTSSGAITIDRALGDVTARSAHGPIRIREVGGGTVRLDNGHADIDVGVPAGTAAWIDASSAHGRVRNELTPDPAAAVSERAVELHLHNSSGTVLIRRVAAPRREASE
ncbi:hypothetical protein E1091_08100 [Micromonospora fluostatini]|uniref:Adhesin domain-containing protein n=1 Tax=Micromonospora fluostatini TaxID=1629071 RepID=A0ABY2DHZ1_9ACTN|nr:hypothetical protein E1091_08100 [Micromonospora fluostatini]